MRLTLYRTKLEHVPAYAHVQDYTVRDRAEPVGRLYQVRALAGPKLAWSWLITVHIDYEWIDGGDFDVRHRVRARAIARA